MASSGITSAVTSSRPGTTDRSGRRPSGSAVTDAGKTSSVAGIGRSLVSEKAGAKPAGKVGADKAVDTKPRVSAKHRTEKELQEAMAALMPKDHVFSTGGSQDLASGTAGDSSRRNSQASALPDAASSSEVRPRKKLNEQFTLRPGREQVSCARFSQDDQFLAAACADGSITVYNALSGKNLFVLDDRQPNAMPPISMRWRPTNGKCFQMNYLTTVHPDGRVMIWNAMSKKCVSEIREDNELFCLAFSPDAQSFAVGGKKREVHIYDFETKQLSATLSDGDGLKTGGHSNRIFGMTYHTSDSNIVLSGSWDKLLQVWDLRKSRPARTILGPYICGDAVDVSKDGKTVLTGSCRIKDQVQTWDFGTGKMVESASWASPGSRDVNKVYSAQFSKGDNGSLIVCGGSGANVARIFDRERGLCAMGDVRGFDGSIVCTDFSHDCRKLAVGSLDGTVQVVSVDDFI
eukprot:TRINITY_DN28993_c0_g1_i1.p1 TRINITY_DN28993_c0_g1~~TRINITY_DN28993_c0_g1_i1.p1  ORF type:complete len:461 (+),score=110.58 TRINITY_DN28993_c0_g1_i1:113-1495(+)